MASPLLPVEDREWRLERFPDPDDPPVSHTDLRRSVQHVFIKLSPSARFACTLTAVEMVWECLRDRYPEAYAEARGYLVEVWNWFRNGGVEDGVLEEIREAAIEGAWSADDEGHEADLLYHGWAALWELSESRPTGGWEIAAEAVVSSAWGCAGGQRFGARTVRFLDQWWSRCRTRLALRDPRSVEVTGARSYIEIQQALTPTPRSFDPLAAPMPRSPEPGWRLESFTDVPGYLELRRSVWNIFGKLSPSARFLCTITAVEMAWECLRNRYPEAYRTAFNVYLREIKDWFRNRWTAPEPSTAIQEATSARALEAEEANDPALFHGWTALGELAATRVYFEGWHVPTNAVISAAWTCAWGDPDSDRIPEFLDVWWSRCRTQLAVRNPESIDVTGTRDYREIEQALVPSTRRFDPLAISRSPAPADWEYRFTETELPSVFVSDLSKRLSSSARFVCAMTAVEMAAPIIGYEPGDRLVRRAWEAFREYGTALPTDVYDALEAPVLLDLAAANHPYFVRRFLAAIRWTVYTLRRLGQSDATGQMTWAVLNAVESILWRFQADTSDAMYRAQFDPAPQRQWPNSALGPLLDEWWARCRARLAMRDPGSVSVTGARDCEDLEDYEPGPGTTGRKSKRKAKKLKPVEIDFGESDSEALDEFAEAVTAFARRFATGRRGKATPEMVQPFVDFYQQGRDILDTTLEGRVTLEMMTNLLEQTAGNETYHDRGIPCLARYPGGKCQSSDWIVPLLPKTKVYVEMFGGVASVLLRKPRSEVEIYNDVSGLLTETMSILSHKKAAAKLQRIALDYISNTGALADRFFAMRDAWLNGESIDKVEPDPFMRTLIFLYGLRMYQTPVHAERMTYEGGLGPGQSALQVQRWLRLVLELSAISARMTGVVTYQQNWKDLVRRLEQSAKSYKWKPGDILVYCDPPYPKEAISVGFNALYGEEGDDWSDVDTDELIQWAVKTPWRVAVSGILDRSGNSPYRELEQHGFKLHKQKRRRSSTRKDANYTECLWIRTKPRKTRTGKKTGK